MTQQVADVSSLVTSAQGAITQLQALLKRAGSVSDLLAVQEQINAQESSLEALLAQQRALAHETSYATVSVTLLGPHHAGAKKATRRGGFVAGLARAGADCGWPVSALLTAVGAVLPFAVVAALAGGRRVRGRRGAGCCGAGPGRPPRPATRRPLRRTGRGGVDQVGQPGQHAGIGLRQHAVAEVEHVTLGRAARVQHLPGPLLDDLPRGEQDRRVQVALQGLARRRPGARLVQRRPASPPRRRPRPPPPSARAARRCRRRSECRGTPGPASASKIRRLCGSTERR